MKEECEIRKETERSLMEYVREQRARTEVGIRVKMERQGIRKEVYAV